MRQLEREGAGSVFWLGEEAARVLGFYFFEEDEAFFFRGSSEVFF